MAAPTTPMPVSAEAQATVVRYLENVLAMYFMNYNIRDQLLQRDLAYYRTNDATATQRKASTANAAGDTSKIQNVTVPIVMPQVESRLAYLQETFLSGHPIFGVVAPPDQVDAIKQVETLLEDNSIRGAWGSELTKTMRDGLKYDYGACEVVWENRKIFNLSTPELVALSNASVTESYYAGNFIRRLDPYNLIADTRVPPEEIHTKGEFVGYSEVLSRIALKKYMEDLPVFGTMNFRKAFETPGTGDASLLDPTSATYIPTVNPSALLPTLGAVPFSWTAWAGLDKSQQGIQYQDSYEKTVLYVRLLPSDFKISVKNRNHVQIWKFVIINRKTVIYAERQTNAHNLLPIIICKPTNDGMAWQSKSFGENVMPLQSVASALVNSGLESQRRKVYDRMLYDPSRVNKKDIDEVSSVARIPVKNTTMGKGLADAVYQIPYRDEGVADVMMLSQQITQMADVVNGQNRVQQGQFQKGNKTRREFDTVMANASNRERLMAKALEDTFFTPIKQIILTNILQYQPPTTLVAPADGSEIKVDPATLRKASIRFKLSDGFMPSEKLVGSDTMGQVFQAATALPGIAVEYDLMGMWTYSMALQGANWLSDFKRTEQQQQAELAKMQAATQAAGSNKAQGQPPSGNPPPQQ